jgi:hypothetical protein
MFKRVLTSVLVSSLTVGTIANAGQLQFSRPVDVKSIGSAEAQVVTASCESRICDSNLANEQDWQLGACDAPSTCDGLGAGACDSKSGLLGLGLMPCLTGLIKPSERCYDDFISPMTNPTFFEDPRQLSEVRTIFINHQLPVLLGNSAGRIQLYAAQIRVRLTERLSLIAVKDGYIVSQSPILDDGWADLSAGLKYTLFRNAEAGRLLSVGARFEAPVGTKRTLQGNGDGVLDVFLSGGTRIGESGHWLTGSGFILPMDSQAENQMFYWSNHLDKRIRNSNFYVLTELNWYNYLKSGSSFGAPIEGGDLFNLGSVDVAGNNLVTNAYGLKYKPNRHLESGVAWEIPLTEREGILDNRLTADLIIRY